MNTFGRPAHSHNVMVTPKALCERYLLRSILETETNFRLFQQWLYAGRAQCTFVISLSGRISSCFKHSAICDASQQSESRCQPRAANHVSGTSAREGPPSEHQHQYTNPTRTEQSCKSVSNGARRLHHSTPTRKRASSRSGDSQRSELRIRKSSIS